MCVFVCLSRVVPCTSWLGVRCGGVCLSWCRAPPLLVGLLGCVCVRACAPLAPRPSWGAACGAGVCGCCRGWGLPPPPPLWFFFGGGGVAAPLGLVVSVPPSPLVRAAPSCVFCFFFPPQRGVCPRVLGVPPPGGPLLPVWCCRFWLGGPPVLLRGVPSSVPSGWGVWPPLVVWVGGFVAVGLSRAPPPFFLGGGSACSSLCLPWAGARTGRHSVWSSGLLLVLAFCQALPRPHGSGGLCTRWARCPFLPG